MSIFKRGSTYYVSIYTRDGRRIKQSARTSDRRLAQQFHDEWKAKLWREDYTDEKPDRTWDQCAVAYLEASQHKATFSTIQMHVRKLREYLKGSIIKDINPDAVEWIKAQRLNEGVAHGTVNRMLEILRAMLNMAVEREWIAKAPKIQMLPEPESRPRWLTYEEESRLLAELPEHLRAMMRFSLSTGLRESNVVNLRWDQIDLDRKCAWIYGDQSKTGQPIAVPLNSAAMAVLQEQPQDSAYVFTYKGRPVTRCNNTAWKKALARAGVQNFTWHNLRSTWASRHVMSGTSMFDLQHLGGWSSQAIRYAALSAEHLAEASENVVRDGPNTVPTETVEANGRTLH